MVAMKSVYKYLWLAIPVLVTLAIPLTILIIIIFNRLRNPGTKLIIDHDAGADDAMAIFMALLSEKCSQGPKVIALTTTHGNVDEDQSYINSQRILTVARRTDISIYRGTNLSMILDLPSDHFFGVDGLGDLDDPQYSEIPAKDVHAAVALIQYSKQYKDKLVIVSLGAVTNIALAVRLDPGFIERIGHIFLAAGHIQSDVYDRPEYNALQDVEAYYMAVRDASPNRMTIIPFSSVLSTMNISKTWRNEVLGAINTNIMKAQNEFERVSIEKGNNVWGLLDPAAMGVFIKSNVINGIEFSKNSITLKGDKRGFTTNDFVDKSTDANVKIVTSFSQNTYQQLLLELFSEC